jgi:23S rRNA pseudouridine1911/1915/1917 synthase
VAQTPDEFLSFTVEDEDAGARLDRFLAANATDLSRTRLQALISEGRVRVDGITTKPSHRLESGQIVEIEIPPPQPVAVAPEAIPLDVLYEDEDLAVINKPAGMVVHPGSGNVLGTLTAALLDRFGTLSAVGGPLRPGIVHRLDKGTSGVLIVARNDAAHRKLVEEFQEREVQKIYVALLHGKLQTATGRIELPVARDLHRRMRMTTRRREGRPARTDWKTKLLLGGFSLVEAGLHTGRTHQLRVHFSALGCPVVGDTLYGAPREERAGTIALPELGRNFLHAARIRFVHPRTEREIEVRAPLPPELATYLKNLGKALNTPPAAIDAALAEYL